MSDHEQTAEEREQIERAKALTASFLADECTIGAVSVRKIPVGLSELLSKVGNRFMVGFSKHEREQVDKGNFLSFITDAIQWREACAASYETYKEWKKAPDLFIDHCDRIAYKTDTNRDELGKMFSDVLREFLDISNARVAVKEAPQAKGQVKKKAHNPHP
jgi:hypothetical protein